MQIFTNRLTKKFYKIISLKSKLLARNKNRNRVLEVIHHVFLSIYKQDYQDLHRILYYQIPNYSLLKPKILYKFYITNRKFFAQ